MFNVYKDLRHARTHLLGDKLRIIQLHYEYLEHYIPSNTTHLKVKDF